MPQILQMKLTGTTELVVVVGLVALIAFMPKLLSFLVESQVGKAVAFGFVAWLWKQHNELPALLLAVALLKAAPTYEHLETKKTTPPGTTPPPMMGGAATTPATGGSPP